MKTNKIAAVALICALMAVSLGIPAKAAESSSKETLWLEDLPFTILDEDIIETTGDYTGSRAFGSIDVTVSAYKARKSESRFPLEAEQTVTLNCVYSPNTASIDYGLIAPNGYFYYVNSTNGRIDQTIQVGERGHYTLAVRNNSSEKISVLGYVYY